jgi:class 3 adenylate cyclase
MSCPTCQAPRDLDARFCTRCGAEIVCASCGSILAAGARYCGQCGSPTQGAADRAPTREDRRQITALFTDLIGSTLLSQTLEPEDLRDLLARYQGKCGRVARKHGGYLAPYIGDGVVVYFGYPRAREDDAERAVRAALELQRELTEGLRTASGARVAARIGIHTGLAVVGRLEHGDHHEKVAVGEAIPTASHLQRLAPAGGVVISEATRRLIAAELICEELRGPRPAWLVRGIGPPRGRQASASGGGSGIPIVGREAEVGALLACWERTCAGMGQVISVSGDAGIGKTRLIAELRDRVGPDSVWLSLECASSMSGSAFHPVVKLIEREAGFASDDDGELKLAKLEAEIARWEGVAPESCVPYLAKLLGLPPSPRFPLPPAGLQILRERTFDALLTPLVSGRRAQPAVVVVEDMHWIDHSTLELIDRLIAKVPAARVLLVGTFRPTFFQHWARHGGRTHGVALGRLSDADTRAVIELTAGQARLSPRVVDAIVQRAEGVPLFAQLLTQMIIEAGDDAMQGVSPTTAIPIQLRVLLTAHLDRLGGAKLVAQIAGVLGREFSAAMIAAVGQFEDDDVAHQLERLENAGMLECKRGPDGATYAFTHVLQQEVAHDSLLRNARRELHATAATVLETRFAGSPAAAPELLALHFAEGGNPARAIDMYAEAARLAVGRLANAEAADHFATALDLLVQLPDTPQRSQREAALRIALAGPLAAIGYDRAETIANQQRLEALAASAAGPAAQLPILTGLAVFHQVRGDLPKARRWATQLLDVAEPIGAKPLCVAGHAIIGAAALTSVGVPLACQHLAEADALAREAQLPPPATHFDIDTQALVSAVRSLALVLNGEPERALELAESGVRRAREIGHLYTLAHNISNSAIVAYFLDDAERAAALGRESLAYAEDRGFHVPESVARVFGGWARARLGDPGGLADVERGLSIALRAGSRGGLVQLHIAAAQAQLGSGNFERCMELVDVAAALMAATGERSAHEPQLLTLRAEAILASGTQTLERAQRLLLEAIDGWHAYQSRWMELPTALLLGEIALRTGGEKEAHARILELVQGFAHELETPRLARARRMLESLEMRAEA